MAWKKLSLGLVWGIVAAGVACLVALFSTDPPRETWFAAVATVAVLTEVAVWTTAAVLGVSVFQGRKAIWRFITRPFRGAR